MDDTRYSQHPKRVEVLFPRIRRIGSVQSVTEHHIAGLLGIKGAVCGICPDLRMDGVILMYATLTCNTD